MQKNTILPMTNHDNQETLNIKSNAKPLDSRGVNGQKHHKDEDIDVDIERARKEALNYLKEQWDKQSNEVDHIKRTPIKGFRATPHLSSKTSSEKRCRQAKLNLVSEMNSPMFGTKIYRFEQEYQGIPIYKSSIIVSYDVPDEPNINSSKVDYIDHKDFMMCLKNSQKCQKKNPEDVVKKALIKYDDQLNYIVDYLKFNSTPYFYYDEHHQESSWQLVYMTNSQLKSEGVSRDKLKEITRQLPKFTDCMVDACSKKVISTFVRRKIKSFR